MTSAIYGGWVVNATPRSHRERDTVRTDCTGGWVDPRAGLGCLGWVRKVSRRPAIGPWTAQLVASDHIDYDMPVRCLYACILRTCTRSFMCFAVAMVMMFYIPRNITLIETYFSSCLFAILIVICFCFPLPPLFWLNVTTILYEDRRVIRRSSAVELAKYTYLSAAKCLPRTLRGY